MIGSRQPMPWDPPQQAERSCFSLGSSTSTHTIDRAWKVPSCSLRFKQLAPRVVSYEQHSCLNRYPWRTRTEEIEGRRGNGNGGFVRACCSVGDDYPRSLFSVLLLSLKPANGGTSDVKRLSINHEPNHKERKHGGLTNERGERGWEAEFFSMRVGDDYPRLVAVSLTASL
jgi:hypothetical protein